MQIHIFELSGVAGVFSAAVGELGSLGVRATRLEFMKTPPMTIGDLRKEITAFSDDWQLAFTLDGNIIAFDGVTVRGRKEISGQKDLLQIAFSAAEDSK